MERHLSRVVSPDRLMMWATTVALIIIGLVSLNSAIAIGRVILPLGILSAINEGLKLRAARRGTPPWQLHVRLALALVYVLLTVLTMVVLIVLNWLPWPLLG